MSKPLEKLNTTFKANQPSVGGVEFEPYILASESLKIVKALNAAIDRINELEAKQRAIENGLGITYSWEDATPPTPTEGEKHEDNL